MNITIKLKLFWMLFISCKIPLFSISLNNLIDITLKNNSDIISSQREYESTLLRSKTMGGNFSPGISFSSSTSLQKDYEWNTTPDNFSTSITYSQSIPGGTQFSVTGSYSFNSATYNEERYILQSPKISFTLTQSLLPFWIQGKISDPTILDLKQQVEYNYYQYIYTKKNILQNLIQSFAYLLIYENDIKIYENFILLVEEQISAVKELKFSGYVNQSKITELENTKWNYEKDLMSVKTNYYSCFQSIQTICGINIVDSLEFNQVKENITDLIRTSLEDIIDPMDSIFHLKLKMLKNRQVLQKQSSAPILNLTVQPSWSLENIKNNDWLDAWRKDENPSWTGIISVELSPFLKAVMSQEKKHYEIDYKQVEKSYENYLNQKKFVQEQYITLLYNYSNKLEDLEKLYDEEKIELEDYEQLYSVGAISKLDFDSLKIKVENCGLNLRSIEVYIWLYEILVVMNK